MRRAARPFLLLLLLATPTRAGQPIHIAVAANFKATLQQISARFEALTGQQVVLSSASSGVLYSQIVNGAPYHLFFAADRDRPQRLAAAGTVPGTDLFCYATGRLTLVGSEGGLEALADPELSLAIGNPVTAPYGEAAMQVLDRPEFLPGRSRQLVRGNNVAQAYQFWHGGAVDLALVPLALASGPSTPVPTDWHAPLQQYAAVLVHNDAVDAYLKWIRSDTVRSLIIEAGYQPCP